MTSARFIPERQCLLVFANKKDRYDLAAVLKEHANEDFRILAIDGTPINMSAISDYPQIEELEISHYEGPDLKEIRGLTRLKRFFASFGHLEKIELDFCHQTLEFVWLANLRRVQDLSRLTQAPMPCLQFLRINSIRRYQPPDFRLFPNLKELQIQNTDWPSFKWLSKLSSVEDLSIWGDKVADNDWRPFIKMSSLKRLHGMSTVFSAAARKEFAQLRPDVEL